VLNDLGVADNADWQAHWAFAFVPAQAIVAKYIELQGIPAARQGGELHRKRRDGEDHDGKPRPELGSQ
jgi:hypothetical protein